MPNISLSIRARLFLMGQLSQVQGEIDDPSRVAAAELFRLVAIPDSDLPLYETSIPGVGVHLNLSNIRNAKSEPMELSKSQLSLALSIAKKFQRYAIHDDAWARPLITDLERSLNS